ncbi:hypothetical protein GGX14DRAFT_473193 [Mycena pura]|uniref:F-box domain-containing protein n=1 Tax=Mycena pura TaxID=153505 RepID=A0AAD6V3U5_9AGAR|nr:hypothetical protein GGX14DRAFT_473193 [Mycena pura]
MPTGFYPACPPELQRNVDMFHALELRKTLYKPSYSRASAANRRGFMKRTVHAPILRLPVEILTKIFALHSDAFRQAFGKPPYNFETELDRLANTQLLTVSGVCAQWHHTAMGTPSLWSTLELNCVLWSNSSRLEKTMDLLAAALSHARKVAIELTIFGEPKLPVPRRVFDLLAQRSCQWRTAKFSCSMESLDLSVLKGRLPSLQKLELNLPQTLHAVDFFEGAPRLENLIVAGALLKNIGSIPSTQLTGLGFERVVPMDVGRVVSLASALPRGAHFRLSIDAYREADHLAVGSSPMVLAISQFSCGLTGYLNAEICSQTLHHMFARLTLPDLRELRLTCPQYCPLTMPHPQFLELSERSGFHRTLKLLSITDVLVSEGDLMASLSSLQCLEHLEMADNRGAKGNSLLMPNDTTLRTLTIHAPDRHLIPRLRNFVYATQVRFTDNDLVAFVASRLEACPSPVFRVEIRPLLGHKGVKYRALQTRRCQLEYVVDGHLSLA